MTKFAVVTKLHLSILMRQQLWWIAHLKLVLSCRTAFWCHFNRGWIDRAGKGASLVGIHAHLRGFESSSRQAYYHCYLVIMHRPLICIWGTGDIHLYLGNEFQAWKDGECLVGSAETTLKWCMTILMQQLIHIGDAQIHYFYNWWHL